MNSLASKSQLDNALDVSDKNGNKNFKFQIIFSVKVILKMMLCKIV